MNNPFKVLPLDSKSQHNWKSHDRPWRNTAHNTTQGCLQTASLLPKQELEVFQLATKCCEISWSYCHSVLTCRSASIPLTPPPPPPSFGDVQTFEYLSKGFFNFFSPQMSSCKNSPAQRSTQAGEQRLEESRRDKLWEHQSEGCVWGGKNIEAIFEIIIWFTPLTERRGAWSSVLLTVYYLLFSSLSLSYYRALVINPEGKSFPKLQTLLIKLWVCVTLMCVCVGFTRFVHVLYLY